MADNASRIRPTLQPMLRENTHPSHTTTGAQNDQLSLQPDCRKNHWDGIRASQAYSRLITVKHGQGRWRWTVANGLIS